MYNLLRSRSGRLLFVLSLLFGSILFGQALTVSADPPAGSPMRLRLRIDSNTLEPNQTTKIYAEFLDRDYQQVANDDTRIIQFGLTSPGSKQTGSGELTPEQVTVQPGEWSGGATFVSRRPGRLVITASSDGLDTSQALVLITGHRTSSLWELIEPVAYAQTPMEMLILPKEFPATPANNKFQVTFQLGFSDVPKKGTIVRIVTSPSAGIVYQNERFEGAKDIVLDGEDANSKYIGIVSANPGKVTVSATALRGGPTDSVDINFAAPEPAKILLESEPTSINPDERQLSVSVQLVDAGGFPLGADRDRKIRVDSATDPNLFEAQTLVLAQGRPCAQSVLRLKQVPATTELKLFALDEGDNSIKAGYKTITIQRPIPISTTWLLLAAIFGGAVGGLARQLHKVGRLDHIRPRWTGKHWDLGLSGRIMGSVVSGLFLYWAVKLGLAQVTLDLGTKVVAFFLGGIGGFAGLVVLDRLVEWIFKLLHWATPSRRKRATASPRLGSPAAVTSSASGERLG